MKRTFRVSAGTIVTFVALSGVGAPAQASGIGFTSIEPRLGLASPEGGIGTTFLLGVTAGLGEIAPNFHLEGTADFWMKSYDESIWGTAYDWSWTNIGLIGGVRYDIPTASRLTPFGTAGLGLHLFRWSSDYAGLETVGDFSTSSTDMEVGLQIGGGVAFQKSESMSLVGRLGFDVNGGADYFFLTAGLRFGRGREGR